MCAFAVLVLTLALLLEEPVNGNVPEFWKICKWANEGCDVDTECCSGECVQSNAGTNHRCATGEIKFPCLYGYHCDDSLICGPDNRCCADYWTTCTKKSDCCDPSHKCEYVSGFSYKHCVDDKVHSWSRASFVHCPNNCEFIFILVWTIFAIRTAI